MIPVVESRVCPTDHHEDPPRQGQPVWCNWCAKRIGAVLDEMPQLFARLYGEILPSQRGMESDRITQSKGSPSPSSAIDLMDEMLRFFWEQEDIVRKEFGFSKRPGGSNAGTDEWDARDLGRCVRFLKAHLERILADPYLFTFGHDLIGRKSEKDDNGKVVVPGDMGWKRRIEVRTKSDQLRHILVGVRCPSCDAMALARDDGDEWISCMPKLGGCGRLWEQEQFDRLTVILADEIKSEWKRSGSSLSLAEYAKRVVGGAAEAKRATA